MSTYSLKLSTGNSHLWQWDTGQKVTVTGNVEQVHFARRDLDVAYVAEVSNGKASIPDALLQASGTLVAYAYTPTNTLFSARWRVWPRQKPETYPYQDTITDLKTIDERFEDMEEWVKTQFGTPLTASTVAGMTDTSKVYVYTGSETGYTSGNWYYWNGTAWTSGGVYNSTAFETDDTLSQSGNAADAAAVGGALAAEIAPEYSTSDTYAVGDYVLHNNQLYRCTTAISTVEAWTAGHWTEVKVTEEVSNLKSDLNIRHINLFNPATITEGHFIAGNGSLSSNANFFASDFIYVSGYDTIKLSYTHIAHWYDINKMNISAVDGMDTLNADATVTIPEEAYYLRFSTYNSNLELAQVGQNVSRNDYYAHDYYKLPYLVLDRNTDTIIVDKSGNGDYTSFTEAVYQNVDNGKDIIVKPGIYDIVPEYVALFGQDVVDNLADSTSGIKNFQFGIRIHDRKVIFESGSHLVCDWTGHTVNATHRFCALRIEPEAYLIGLDLDCTATFYCIHDDYGTADNAPFTIKYENCRVIGHNLYNANCIGGGAHKYSRHLLENCYFKNNVDSNDIVLSADVRYHNTNTAGAEPELYVANCYFSNNLNVTYYGTQTTKMRAYINNCFAPNGINKVRESSTMNVDNVDLYLWNNQPN